jgi:hypothetical protein
MHASSEMYQRHRTALHSSVIRLILALSRVNGSHPFCKCGKRSALRLPCGPRLRQAIHRSLLVGSQTPRKQNFNREADVTSMDHYNGGAKEREELTFAATERIIMPSTRSTSTSSGTLPPGSTATVVGCDDILRFDGFDSEALPCQGSFRSNI